MVATTPAVSVIHAAGHSSHTFQAMKLYGTAGPTGPGVLSVGHHLHYKTAYVQWSLKRICRSPVGTLVASTLPT